MKEFEKQISLFDGSVPFKIDKPIRLIELFAGIGAQAKALERLQDEGLCEFEHYRICEFDRFAVASYNAIHGRIVADHSHYGWGGQEVKILDEQNGYIRNDGTVGTITTGGSSPKHNNRVIEDTSNIRIRKLTPKECFRLMDFDDADFEKASKVNSDSQLYKQAGNSIVVNCLYLIFKEMM